MAQHLTDAMVKRLPVPADGNRVTYDDKVKGFGVRVTAGDARSFVLNYRTRSQRERRYTIGAFPAWTVSAARLEAADLRKRIDRGDDPMAEAQADRDAKAVADLVERFEAEHLPKKRPATQRMYKAIIANDANGLHAAFTVAMTL